MSAAPSRIATLDLARGIAVLGILAVNLGGFAGPMAATITPAWNGPVGAGDEWAFAIMLVLFEGKMRALFSLLFGASLLLFIERAEAQGRNGSLLQMRRLGWLALFGYLHFLLLWWGDILFTYALAGLVVLALRRLPARALVPVALLIFTVWHAGGMAKTAPGVLEEAKVLAGATTLRGQGAYFTYRAKQVLPARQEMWREKGEYARLVRYKAQEEPAFPINAAISTLCESVPLMLIGLALYIDGFFTGGWSRRRLKWMAWLGIGGGGLITLAITAFAMEQHFPRKLMNAAIGFWLALPHLMMALGYLAAIALAAPALLRSSLGQRIEAAGRMAFTNYLGCTLVMTGIFYGWGLDLMGRVPERWYWAFVLGGWLVMLAWSKPWLARFRQGPLEWLWRSLTFWRLTPMRKPAASAA